LLDEPLSNLDARLRVSVRLELKRLHHQIKGTIIYVTHDQVEAMTLGDKVVVMRAGKVHQIGPPDTIYTYPTDRFVATFIGAPEMNLYRGTLLVKDGHCHFQGKGFSFDLGEFSLTPEENEVELGIRPEDIKIGSETNQTAHAAVEMVSNVGSEKYIHTRIGEESLTLRAPKDTLLNPGTTIPLTIDPRRVHIFHKGRRINQDRNEV
jgi:multiple sugar transport system ATP-binding protein